MEVTGQGGRNSAAWSSLGCEIKELPFCPVVIAAITRVSGGRGAG